MCLYREKDEGIRRLMNREKVVDEEDKKQKWNQN